MSRITSVVSLFSLCAVVFIAAPSIALAGPHGYRGTVSESESRKIGESFTFANLDGSKPLIIYPRGTSNEAIKVFENEELVVLMVVAQLTGSTEMFYVSKKAKRFTLVEITTFDATFNPGKFSEGIVRPQVTYGKLN